MHVLPDSMKEIQIPSPVRKPIRAERTSTRDELIQAAASEFNEQGFSGTDTNRIARRAGFAPQTFYRWFEDKVEIFIRVYELWQQQELGILRKLLAQSASDLRLAQACVAHHKAFLVFRRSLRQLSIENDVVRAARAQSRRRQIAYLRTLKGSRSRSSGELAATLFQIERLSDALAEGEFRDMALDDKAGEEALALLIRQLRGPA